MKTQNTPQTLNLVILEICIGFPNIYAENHINYYYTLLFD
jgi:hypothetical protein